MRLRVLFAAVGLAAVLIPSPAAAADEPTDLAVTGSVTALDGYPSTATVAAQYNVHNYGPNTINATRYIDIWAPGGATISGELPRGYQCTNVTPGTHLRCRSFEKTPVDGVGGAPKTGVAVSINFRVTARDKLTCGKVQVTYGGDTNHGNDTGYIRLVYAGQPSSCTAKPAAQTDPSTTASAVPTASPTAMASVSPPASEVAPSETPAWTPAEVGSPLPAVLAGDSAETASWSATTLGIAGGFGLMLIGGGLLWWRRRLLRAAHRSSKP
jgi:hypothetical protein